MSEEPGETSGVTVQGLSRSRPLPLEPLVLADEPPHQIVVDSVEGGEQRGRVKPPEVVDPAPHDRVDLPGKLLQSRVTAHVQPPPADLHPDLLGGLVADSRVEA